MRISDWSSDVCSSDLAALARFGQRLAQLRGLRRDLLIKGNDVIDRALDRAFEILAADLEHAPRRNAVGDHDDLHVRGVGFEPRKDAVVSRAAAGVSWVTRTAN